MMLEAIIYACSRGIYNSRSIAFDGAKLKANASVRQIRDREGLEKEIERIKEQMWLMKDRRGVIQPRHNGQIGG